MAVDSRPMWGVVSAHDRVKVVRALLAAGAKVNRAGRDGLKLVDRARRAGYVEIVRLLEEAAR